MKNLLKAAVCLLLIGYYSTISGQTNRIISGVVTDSLGDPIPGVTILVKGTSTRTFSDIKGKYSLEVPENTNLQFGSIGYTTQEVAVGENREINVVMIEAVAPKGIKPAEPINLSRNSKKELTLYPS